MPFLSKSQRRKFYALKSEGKMTQNKIDEWEQDTPKNIPERVEKRANMSLFSKVAADAYASKDSMGAFLNWNDKGGITPRNPDDEMTASSAGLKTLPAETPGANCGTCRYFKVLDAKMGSGFCVNPELKQEVTARMLCDFWENPGTEMAVEEPEPSMMDGDPAMQQDPASTQQGGEMAEQNGQDSPSMQQSLQDQMPSPAEEAGSGFPEDSVTKPPAKKEENPDEKKTSKGPQVNIKVDSGEKQASLQDFVMEGW